MADEAFEKQIRLAELQIKATEILGKYKKDIAEARKIDAEALAIETRDDALRSIQKQLDLDLTRLRKHRHQFESKQEIILHDINKIKPLQTGYKISSLSSLYDLHEALSRLLTTVNSKTVSAFLSYQIQPDTRPASNFIVVGNKAELSDVSDDIINLGSLLDWTKEKGLFFKKSRPAHLMILKAFEQFEDSINANIIVIETALKSTLENDMKSIKYLEDAIGLNHAESSTS